MNFAFVKSFPWSWVWGRFYRVSLSGDQSRIKVTLSARPSLIEMVEKTYQSPVIMSLPSLAVLSETSRIAKKRDTKIESKVLLRVNVSGLQSSERNRLTVGRDKDSAPDP